MLKFFGAVRDRSANINRGESACNPSDITENKELVSLGAPVCTLYIASYIAIASRRLKSEEKGAFFFFSGI
jgi:hypothetical protein